MSDKLKGRLCVLLFFALLGALALNWALPKRYSEAKVMSPEFQREFIRQDFAKYNQTIDPDNLIIIGAEKIDDTFLIGYALVNGPRPWSSLSCHYGIASFQEYYGGYIFIHRYHCFSLDIPELAHYDIMTNYRIGSQGKQGDYEVFLSLAENLRQVKLFYKTERRRDGKPDEKPNESWQLIKELDVEQCPAMLIMPDSGGSGSYRTYYAFLDENGEEIACLDIRHSYSTDLEDWD